MDHRAYLGVGSNLGRREDNCFQAIRYLEEHPHVRVEALSGLYENPALTLNGEEQPQYLNGALKIMTDLQPEELLEVVKEVEHKMGRPLTEAKWSSRIIDLDILFYDDLVYASERLTIPHPELEKRMFVLKPLSDIEKNLVHPVLGRTIKELINIKEQEASLLTSNS